MELLKTAEKRGKEFVNKNKEKNSGSLADKTSKTYYKEFKKVRNFSFFLFYVKLSIYFLHFYHVITYVLRILIYYWFNFYK